jgi:hypothetical protein
LGIIGIILEDSMIVNKIQNDIKDLRRDSEHVDKVLMITRILSILPSKVDVTKLEHR